MSAKLPIADFGRTANLGESLGKVMADHERWSIQNGRITHDTGLSIVYHKPVGRWGSSTMELSFADMVPFKIDIEKEDLAPYYGLLGALSRGQAKETFERVATLLKLAAE